MEPKKNPEVDVSRFGIVYFQVGLCLMMFFTYFGLEYKSYRYVVKSDDIVSIDEAYESSFEEDIPVMTIQTPVTTVAPIAIGNEGIKVVDNLSIIEETVMESTEMSQMDVVGKVVDGHVPILKIENIAVKEVEEDVEIPFAAIESAPIFPGCENGTRQEKRDCFQRKMQEHVAKHFVYPELALDRGIYGKVYIMFVIDKNGQVSNVKLRGPHKILEEEAERIINLIPKMIPGKQRGKPAKVTYSLPINFKYVNNQ